MARHRTWVEISERALGNNINTLRGLLSEETRFCAVIKANAYGHGLKEVAQITGRHGVDAFAVDALDDALELRKSFPAALILVLGYTLQDRLLEGVKNDIHFTVYNLDTVLRLEEEAQKLAKQAHVHLKVETGTSRQGILEKDLRDFLEHIRNSHHLTLSGVSTHFANIEDTTDTSYAAQQLERFQQWNEKIKEADFRPDYIHCACSAAVILYPATHGTLVRTGISLYGIWPSEVVESTSRKHAIGCHLEPALTWKTRIAQVKSLPAGTPVSYGLTEYLGRQSRIAVLPVGYWDGYDRALSSIGEVLIAGQRCKVIGRICMNMMMVDVSTVPNAEPGQEVILIGRSGRQEVSANDLAKLSGTIPYEVLARINPTLPRVIVSQ